MTNISEAAIEAAAQAIYVSDNGPWISGGALTPGGTPWGTSREATDRPFYLEHARAALEAAGPLIAAQALREAADELWSRNHRLGPPSWLNARAAALEA